MIRPEDNHEVGYELVVKMRPEVAPPNTSNLELIHSKAIPAILVEAMPNGSISKMFPGSTLDATPPLGLRDEAAKARDDSTLELSRFYGIKGDSADLQLAAERLRASGLCESVILRPLPTPPSLVFPSATTPDFTGSQGYLRGSSLGGIDAEFAWSKGISGQGIRVTDVEGDWNLSHEDLPTISRIGSGSFGDHNGWWNHGTAVLGVMGSQNNGRGTLGIAPRAVYSTSSIFDAASNGAAILAAANRLGPGDIIVLEVQIDYRAPEWWEDYFLPIQLATRNGILVVEAAGNGNTDLDDTRFDTGGGSSGWINPYRRDPSYDSGSIVVGAGAPPSGNFGADRSRLDFSNYGSMVDAQGWGREVFTLGYGDAHGGTDDTLYTSEFSGTSSATPIVAGALVLVQSFLKSRGVQPMNYTEARNLLRSTGKAQVGDTSERIGTRPDLRQMIAQAALWRGIPSP
ncbi:MAG TPA: S8 family serine peptidase [Fimbriimonas sp.]|nr:S8 family serine peptidase [Fimbriimonas sp.]